MQLDRAWLVDSHGRPYPSLKRNGGGGVNGRRGGEERRDWEERRERKHSWDIKKSKYKNKIKSSVLSFS